MVCEGVGGWLLGSGHFHEAETVIVWRHRESLAMAATVKFQDFDGLSGFKLRQTHAEQAEWGDGVFFSTHVGRGLLGYLAKASGSGFFKLVLLLGPVPRRV